MKAGWIASSSSRHSQMDPRFENKKIGPNLKSNCAAANSFFDSWIAHSFLYVPQNHHTRTRGTSISGTTHCTDTVLLPPPPPHTHACTRSKDRHPYRRVSQQLPDCLSAHRFFKRLLARVFLVLKLPPVGHSHPLHGNRTTMYLLKAKKLHDKEVAVEYEAEKKERRAMRRQRRKERSKAREAAREGEWQDMDFNCRYMGSFEVRRSIVSSQHPPAPQPHPSPPPTSLSRS